MKSKRPISINNSLVHGICNYNCITCSVNKSSYSGPKDFQPEKTTKKIIQRVKEAARMGLYIKQIDNSGDGEPLLHPEFDLRMNLFGELIRGWEFEDIKPPRISVVTNGRNLGNGKIFDALKNNNISLKISFPTSDPKNYGEIMVLDSKKGKQLIEGVILNIKKAMELVAKQELPDLVFHISPPFYKYIRKDFEKTLRLLVSLAAGAGMKMLEISMFPTVANRGGGVNNEIQKIDMYKDYFRKYNNKIVSGVKIKMFLSHKHFYENKWEFLDVINAYSYPCLWYAGNILVSPDGGIYCCNDQNLQEPQANIFKNTIGEIMKIRETQNPAKICKVCNQTPSKLMKLGIFRSHHLLALIKIKMKN